METILRKHRESGVNQFFIKSKEKTGKLQKKYFIFQEMEISSSSIKKILIPSQKKAFLTPFQKKPFSYISGNGTLHYSAQDK